MKKFDKLLEVLFKTKNYNKILIEFNKLSLVQKQLVLSNDKVKKRIYKFSDVNFLTNILIELPYDFRKDFLNDIDLNKYSLQYQKDIVEFLRLQNYEDFEVNTISNFANIKDKQVVELIFRKLSAISLKQILINNYSNFVDDYAFIEYSKKTPDLFLNADILQNISDTVLFTELKRRELKSFNTTSIDIENFLKLSVVKQHYILYHNKSEKLEQDLVEQHLKKYSLASEEEIVKRFNILMKNVTYINNLLEMQCIIYSVDDDLAKDLMKSYLIKVYKIEEEIMDKYLNCMIYNFKKLNLKNKELFEVMKLGPFSLILYLNTGIIDFNFDKEIDTVITFEQFQTNNLKKVNKISNLLEKIECIDNVKPFAYKLYYILGYENTIEFLNNKFGNVVDSDIVFKLFKNCDISKVQLEQIGNNYEPVLKTDFVRFIIGEKKDNNTTIKRMLRNELDLIVKEFSNIYNNFERFQDIIGNKIHLNKLIPLLQENPFMLLPNEYKFTKDIIDMIIKSYGYNEIIFNDNFFERKACVEEACDFYHNFLDKRISSSIPRVIGTTEKNYQYEVLRLDDLLIMTLGYQTGCCFRLNGASKEFMQYCSENSHARVIVIRNDSNEICSMIPIIRNGNVVVGNSIESNGKGSPDYIYLALKQAFDDIIKISNNTEIKPIIAGCVTNLHDNVSKYSNNEISKNIYPITEETFYNNYDWDTYIVSIINGKTESDFELYLPDSLYIDDRPEILIVNRRNRNFKHKELANNRIKSIIYQTGKEDYFVSYADYVVCGEDWYLYVDYERIRGQYLNKDPRAKREYELTKLYLETKFNKSEYYDACDLNEFDIKENCIDDVVSNRNVLIKKFNTNN